MGISLFSAQAISELGIIMVKEMIKNSVPGLILVMGGSLIAMEPEPQKTALYADVAMPMQQEEGIEALFEEIWHEALESLSSEINRTGSQSEMTELTPQALPHHNKAPRNSNLKRERKEKDIPREMFFKWKNDNAKRDSCSSLYCCNYCNEQYGVATYIGAHLKRYHGITTATLQKPNEKLADHYTKIPIFNK